MRVLRASGMARSRAGELAVSIFELSRYVCMRDAGRAVALSWLAGRTDLEKCHWRTAAEANTNQRDFLS